MTQRSLLMGNSASEAWELTITHLGYLRTNFVHLHLSVSKNRGIYPPKWMVLDGSKPYVLMDDLGVPLFLETLI